MEFLTIYTLYVISCFRPEATGPELVACVEEAVSNCPEPAEVISRHRKKSGRQPSGEEPLVKLERMYNALRTERLKSKDAHLYDEKAIQHNEMLLNMAWRLYADQLKAAAVAGQLTPRGGRKFGLMDILC